VIINEYSLPEISQFQTPVVYRGKKETGERKRSKINYFNLLFSVILVLLMVASAFYTQKVLKDIQEMKAQQLRLKKVYYGTVMATEKIHVMIDEIKDNQYREKQLIKIMGEHKFKKQAEDMRKNYITAHTKADKSYFGYALILGLMILVVIRLVYLELFQKNKYDLAQN